MGVISSCNLRQHMLKWAYIWSLGHSFGFVVQYQDKMHWSTKVFTNHIIVLTVNRWLRDYFNEHVQKNKDFNVIQSVYHTTYLENPHFHDSTAHTIMNKISALTQTTNLNRLHMYIYMEDKVTWNCLLSQKARWLFPPHQHGKLYLPWNFRNVKVVGFQGQDYLMQTTFKNKIT